MTTNAKSPGRVVGENIRTLRELQGGRQDGVAAAARECGLKWSQATVAALETGKREVATGELLLLPVVLSRSLGVKVNIADLLQTSGNIRLGPDAAGSQAYISAALGGDVGKVALHDLDVPWTRDFGNQGFRRWTDRLSDQATIVAQLWPEARLNAAVEAEGDAGQLVERRAAKRLGVDPFAVALLARRMWGHGLTAERDARLALQAEGPAKSGTAGQVTLKLVAELRSALDQAGMTKEEKF